MDTPAELRIPQTTAYEIIRKFVETGERRGRHGGGGQRPVLDDKAKNFLVMLVEAIPTITISELNRTLRQTFPGKPHVRNLTVSRALDGELLTLKQVRNAQVNNAQVNCKSEAVKDACVAFVHYMYDEGIHNRVYVDEIGYNLYTSRAYVRAPRGRRINRMVAGQRGTNITLITAVFSVAGLF